MFLTKRARWMVMSGIAGAAAAQAAEFLLTRGWTLAAGTAPPDDPAYDDVDWKSALIWAAVAATTVGIAQLAARQGAATVWRQTTGKRPPGPRKRKRLRAG